MASRYKNLFQNTILLGVGKFASKLIVLLLMQVYTSVLSAEQFGVADLIQQTANFLIPFACAGLCDGIMRYMLDNENREKVYSSAFFAVLTGCAACGALCCVFLAVNRLSPYFWLIAVYVLCSDFHGICSQTLRAENKTAAYAGQGILNTLLTVVFNLLFLFVTKWNVVGFILSTVLADFCVGLLIFLVDRQYRFVSFRNFDGPVLRDMLRFSLPMMPTAILWTVTSVSDRYFVAYFSGDAENGIYAAAYKIPTLLSLVCGIFNEAWQFSAVKDVEDKEKSDFFSRVFRSYSAVLFTVGGALILLCRILVRIVLNANYYEGWRYVPILVMATLVCSLVTFEGSVYFVTKKSIMSMFTALSAALVNLILNAVMIPSHGAMGAAVATLISYLCAFAARTVDTRKTLPYRISWISLTANFLLLGFLSALMMWQGRYSFLLAGVCFIAILCVNVMPLIRLAREFIGSFLKRSRKQKHSSSEV